MACLAGRWALPANRGRPLSIFLPMKRSGGVKSLSLARRGGVSNLAELRQQLQAAGRYLLANELTWGNAGNLSARLAAGSYLITASGTHLGNLADDELLECSLEGSPTVAAGRRPSKETPMHAAVYQRRPDIQAVLHASPFYSTLIAC